MSHIISLQLNKTQPQAFVGNWNLPLQFKRYFEYFNNLIWLWNLYPWDIVAWNFFLLTFNLFTTSINNGFENQIKILYSHKINRLWCVVNAIFWRIVFNSRHAVVNGMCFNLTWATIASLVFPFPNSYFICPFSTPWSLPLIFAIKW